MFVPYDYQGSCLQSLSEAREANQKEALIIMASGLGKTATAAFDVREWLRANPSSRVLYLCNKNRVLKQARDTFIEIIGGDPSLYGFYHGKTKERDVQFVFASFQTMWEHFEDFAHDEFDYVIVDEGHHIHAPTFFRSLGHFRAKFLLGMTATPNRGDLKDIRTVFGKEVFSLNLPEALAHGYLTSVDYRLMTDDLVEFGLIENPYRLSLAELNRRIFAPKRDEEIVRIIHEKLADIEDPRILTFCHSIAHAERFHGHYAGSLPIHSKLDSDEQDNRLDAFERREYENIISVDKFNEGVDVPDLNVLVFLRSTETYNIFYQQLGRGLRKMAGKEKVLALDFVANCERVRQIYALSEAVKKAQLSIKLAHGREGRSHSKSEVVVVDFGSFTFTETAMDILTVLGEVERGYTRDVLIGQLQAEAQRRGGKLLKKHIEEASRQRRTASYMAFWDTFGSWNNALEAAGLAVNQAPPRPIPAKEILIEQLRSEGKQLKRIPKPSDMDVASVGGRTESAQMFRRAFGLFGNALRAAGFRPRESQSELLDILREEMKFLGQPPTLDYWREQAKVKHLPSVTTFRNRFGTWKDALQAATEHVFQKGRLVTRGRDKEDVKRLIISQLRSEAKRLERGFLGRTDIQAASKAGRTVSGHAIVNHFGGIVEALQAAGLEYRKIDRRGEKRRPRRTVFQK